MTFSKLSWRVFFFSKASISDPEHAYLSILTPLLSQEDLLPHGLSHYTMEMVKKISPSAVEIVEPPKEGYQLTLRLNLTTIPKGKSTVILYMALNDSLAKSYSSRGGNGANNFRISFILISISCLDLHINFHIQI